jgi:hypothetical protein
LHSNSSHSIHRSSRAVLIGLASSAVSAAALFAAPAGAALAAPAAASPMALAAGSVSMTLVRQTPVSGGDVATTWRAGGAHGVEVRSAGLPGSQVGLAVVGRDSANAWIAPPASAAAMSPARYAKSGRSVYWDALAAGMSKAQAVKATLELGDRLPAAAHVSAAPKVITPNVFFSACTTAYAGIYDEFYGTACIQQSYLESQPGAYYLNNQVTSSGGSEIQGFNLVMLSANYCWCDNGYTYTRVGWSPSASIPEGSPTTRTLTAAWGGFSASIQATIYPQSLNPIFPSGVTEPAFGSEWLGSDTSPIVDSANSVAIVHEGPGSPGPARVVVSITGVD